MAPEPGKISQIAVFSIDARVVLFRLDRGLPLRYRYRCRFIYKVCYFLAPNPIGDVQGYKMSSSDAQSGWFQRLQGNFILPIARAFYALAATGCFVTIVGGILVAFYLQMQISAPVSGVPLPPAYSPSAHDLDQGLVDTKLKPPTNVRFVVVKNLDSSISEKDITGYFEADSGNALAEYPNDFDILGGKDADLFARGSGNLRFQNGNVTQRSMLRPTAAFTQQAAEIFKIAALPERRVYQLRVIARDEWGNLSAATNVDFTLVFALATATDHPPPPPASPVQKAMTDLEGLAREIAVAIDPDQTPTYFDAFHKALRVPNECRVPESEKSFLAAYRAAFQRARDRLTITNFQGFTRGLCDAWWAARKADAADEASAEAARQAVWARNQAHQVEHGMAVIAASAAQKLTLMIVGCAIGAFLSISLLLAFLSMENHSRAIREAVQALTKNGSAREN